MECKKNYAMFELLERHDLSLFKTYSHNTKGKYYRIVGVIKTKISGDWLYYIHYVPVNQPDCELEFSRSIKTLKTHLKRSVLTTWVLTTQKKKNIIR